MPGFASRTLASQTTKRGLLHKRRKACSLTAVCAALLLAPHNTRSLVCSNLSRPASASSIASRPIMRFVLDAAASADCQSHSRSGGRSRRRRALPRARWKTLRRRRAIFEKQHRRPLALPRYREKHYSWNSFTASSLISSLCFCDRLPKKGSSRSRRQVAP